MVATHRLTVDEFATTCREGIWELIDGEPIAVTPSAGRSSWVSGRNYASLADYVEPNRLGWAFPAAAGCVLFDDRATVRSPDAAVVLRERLPEPPDSFIPLAPDLTVDVLSSSDRMVDALSKVAMYLQAGVRLVWLIDPASLTVNVFRPDAAPLTLRAGDALDGGNVLPGFSLPVTTIFT